MRAEGLGCLMVASSWIAKWLQGELVRTEVLGCLMNATSWIVKWLQGELVRTEVLGCSSFDSVRSRILLKRVSQFKPGVSPKSNCKSLFLSTDYTGEVVASVFQYY